MGARMGLKATDFQLTESQLAEINRYIVKCAAGYAAEGEYPASQVCVAFCWAAGLGRFVTVNYNCQASIRQIEGFF